VCPAGALAAAAAAIQRVHPYEEPAWDVVPLAARPRAGFGQGRGVTLSEPVSLDALLDRIKRHLGRTTLRVAVAPAHRAGGHVRRVAVCAGSGGELLGRAEGFDVHVTGELSHHALIACQARGTSVVLCEHSSSERGYLPTLARRLVELTSGACEVVLSESDREPVEVL
jgi:putative NIF3 family GTP cyclohydrolase 1 type 2